MLDLLQREEQTQEQEAAQGMPGEQSMVDSMMGGGPGIGPGGMPGGGGPGGRATRQPITPNTARPSPVGQNLAG